MPHTNHSSDRHYRETNIEDMLGRPPGWLLRSGIGMIALVLVLGVGLTASIHYPDQVKATFVLQTETIPLELRGAPGRIIDSIRYKSDAFVQLGDTLLAFRSEVDPIAGAVLLNWVNNLPTTVGQLPSSPPTGRYGNTIQSALSELIRIIHSRRSYLLNNRTIPSVAAFRKEISKTEELGTALDEQLNLYRQELTFLEKDANRNIKLNEDGVVSEKEVEQSSSALVSNQRQLKALESSAIQYQLRIDQLRQQILDTQLSHVERLDEFNRQYQVALHRLRSEITTHYEQNYLVARDSGLVTWQPWVRIGATITGGEPLGFLLPDVLSPVVRLQLPDEGIGKVSVGDPVVLEFSAYPPEEYGQVNGRLAKVDAIAIEDLEGQFQRLATVELPDQLNTTYGRVLDFSFNLTGQARIITAKHSLLSRLLNQFLHLSNNT